MSGRSCPGPWCCCIIPTSVPSSWEHNWGCSNPGFWWMMFGPCCGLKKSSENWFFITLLIFVALLCCWIWPSTAECHGGHCERSRFSSFPNNCVILPIFRLQKISVSSEQGQRAGMAGRWLFLLQLSPGFGAQNFDSWICCCVTQGRAGESGISKEGLRQSQGRAGCLEQGIKAKETKQWANLFLQLRHLSKYYSFTSKQSWQLMRW